LVYEGKSAPLVSDVLLEGHTWQVDVTTYRIERVTRRDVLSPDWSLLFRLMQELTQVYGIERIRLVVWFDADVRQ
jgi:hypothetical protein